MCSSLNTGALFSRFFCMEDAFLSGFFDKKN